MTPEEWAVKVQDLYDMMGEEGAKLEDLPDSFVWKNLLTNMLSAFHYEHLQIPKYMGILLSGPSGNGKRTLMRAYIQSLCKAEQCFGDASFVRLRAEDFTEEKFSSDEDMGSFIDVLYQIGENNGQIGIIVFDQIDTYPRLDVFCNLIADYCDDEAFSSIHVICICEDEDCINSELSAKLLHCRCTNPTAKEREKYLNANLTWDVPDWETYEGLIKTVTLSVEGRSNAKLAEQTEGFSFGELADLVQYMKMEAAGKTFGSASALNIKISEDKADEFINLAHRKAKASGGGTVVYQAGAAFAVPQAAGGMPVSAEDARKNRARELTSKGDDERTVDENLELIDLVPTLEEAKAAG